MGKVYLVGAGPGDPDLITIKALKCIREADIILYDRLVNKCLLEEAKPDATLIYCGKLPNNHTMKQEAINALLVQCGKQDKVITRLKGGDPFVFGRGAEEAEALVENGIPFEIVPGITSGIAAPAYAGIPVTHREYGNSFAVITGHGVKGKPADINWEGLAKGVDTLVVYMGVGNLSYICQSLLNNGKSADTPIALVHWGTKAEQRTVTGTLSTIVEVVKEKKIENPSMIIIGEVVKVREKIAWFKEDNLVESKWFLEEESV
ncbi:uroporphyrinogen-III C-methyltransferase [Peribacillus asahii]|uniref:uroporphyrinogen-III C-methyltransferase n=1 Tax=Peribacillus asahii TaxID=228899 RepID=UPI00207A1B27|nr:uroporphyrinogen-III C-methyltransferase [Peribacillus asahii]USK70686.1 uroporphyrinogen-III C-methyltransferase [Peribacillus asahii]